MELNTLLKTQNQRPFYNSCVDTFKANLLEPPAQGESLMVLFDIFQGVKTCIRSKKLRYCVIDQSDIQRDGISLG